MEVYGWLMGIEWGNIGIYTYIYNHIGQLQRLHHDVQTESSSKHEIVWSSWSVLIFDLQQALSTLGASQIPMNPHLIHH